jgi:hypothetical protein
MSTFLVGRNTSYNYSTRQLIDEGDLAVEECPFKTIDQKKLLEQTLKSPVEACSRLKEPVLQVGSRHQLFEAVALAHNYHFPLVLDPDVVWLTIAQGLANHINNNAEKLRKRFVAHEGKKKIIIQRDAFAHGSPENDWPGAFAEFSSKIKESIGEHNHSLIVADFSTTGPIERAASEVVLMDAMKSYFRYGMMTMCGIPSVSLDGKVEDWERILDKVNQWEVAGPPPPGMQTLDSMVPPPALDLEWWTDSLKVILRQFINAAKGNPDRAFWNDIYQESGGSGVPRVGGWISWMFPYIGPGADEKNEFIGKTTNGRQGVDDDQIPSSLSKVPFEWNYNGTTFDYDLVAGLTGTTQALPDKPVMMKTGGQPAPAYSVRPLVGWAVRPTPKNEVNKKGSVFDNIDPYMDE